MKNLTIDDIQVPEEVKAAFPGLNSMEARRRAELLKVFEIGKKIGGGK